MALMLWRGTNRVMVDGEEARKPFRDDAAVRSGAERVDDALEHSSVKSADPPYLV